MAAHNDGRSFAQRLSAYSVQVNENARRVFHNTAMVAVSGLAQQSPVDTGYFVGNWDVVGPSELPSTGRFGTRAMLEETKSPAQSNRIRAEMVTRANARTSQVPLGKTISIANMTEYGIYLEQGHSKQAPQGIVRTVALGLRMLLSQQRILGRRGGG